MRGCECFHFLYCHICNVLQSVLLLIGCQVLLVLGKLGIVIVDTVLVDGLQETLGTYVHHVVINYECNLVCFHIQIAFYTCATSLLYSGIILRISRNATVLTLKLYPAIPFIFVFFPRVELHKLTFA